MVMSPAEESLYANVGGAKHAAPVRSNVPTMVAGGGRFDRASGCDCDLWKCFALVTQVCVNAASDVIGQNEHTRVSREMRRAFYELLCKPPEAGPVLRELAANAIPAGVELVEE